MLLFRNFILVQRENNSASKNCDRAELFNATQNKNHAFDVKYLNLTPSH